MFEKPQNMVAVQYKFECLKEYALAASLRADKDGEIAKFNRGVYDWPKIIKRKVREPSRH